MLACSLGVREAPSSILRAPHLFPPGVFAPMLGPEAAWEEFASARTLQTWWATQGSVIPRVLTVVSSCGRVRSSARDAVTSDDGGRNGSATRVVHASAMPLSDAYALRRPKILSLVWVLTKLQLSSACVHATSSSLVIAKP